MWTVIPLAALLVIATTMLHYEALRRSADWIVRVPVPGRMQVVLAILVCFLAHTVEIGLFAAAYAALAASGQGAFGGEPTAGAVDYFYYSATSFTSLGLGDVFPTGAMRLLTGIEGLTGLILIAWSASYIFLTMERTWSPARDRKS